MGPPSPAKAGGDAADAQGEQGGAKQGGLHGLCPRMGPRSKGGPLCLTAGDIDLTALRDNPAIVHRNYASTLSNAVMRGLTASTAVR